MKKVGHLEAEEFFCFKCGSEMINNEKEYKLFVDKLKQAPAQNNPFKVLKSGTNSYGFWYLVKANEDFFNEARRVGLRVSDAKGDDNDIKFIASGTVSLLTCQECNIEYDKSKMEFIETLSMF